MPPGSVLSTPPTARTYLVKKGLPFRTAYKIVGELVALCIEKHESFETLPLADYKAVSEVFDEGVYAAVDLAACVKGRACVGGPAPEAVKRQIEKLENFLASEELEENE